MAKLKVKVSGKMGVYNVSPKSKTTALILCILFGYFGAHYFYVGRTGRGLVSLFTVNFMFIGYIIDIICIASGKFKDKDGLLVQ